jgi:hypothetical protein
VRVIPVFVDGARPLRQQLSADLQKFTLFNALELSYGRHAYDADRPLGLLQRVLATAFGIGTGDRTSPVANVQAVTDPQDVRADGNPLLPNNVRSSGRACYNSDSSGLDNSRRSPLHDELSYTTNGSGPVGFLACWGSARSGFCFSRIDARWRWNEVTFSRASAIALAATNIALISCELSPRRPKSETCSWKAHVE